MVLKQPRWPSCCPLTRNVTQNLDDHSAKVTTRQSNKIALLRRVARAVASIVLEAAPDEVLVQVAALDAPDDSSSLVELVALGKFENCYPGCQ